MSAPVKFRVWLADGSQRDLMGPDAAAIRKRFPEGAVSKVKVIREQVDAHLRRQAATTTAVCLGFAAAFLFALSCSPAFAADAKPLSTRIAEWMLILLIAFAATMMFAPWPRSEPDPHDEPRGDANARGRDDEVHNRSK